MQRPSLLRQTAGTQALGIVALKIFSLLSIIVTALYSLAQRSAGDLAGLLIMSVQTYAELPAEQHPAFLKRLALGNGIVIAPSPGDFNPIP